MRRTTTLAALAGLMLPLGLAALASTPAQAAGETCDGKAATIVVPPSPDQPLTDNSETTPVVGTPGDDVIVGTDARDTIDGAGGHDTICALGGDDTVRGGEGNDRLFGGLDGIYVYDDLWGDSIMPGPGDDYVDLGHDPQSEDLYFADHGYWDQISFRDAASGVTVDLQSGTATGEGSDTIAPIVHAAGIEGSRHDDVLLGTENDDWINAGGGDDKVVGRGGMDEIDADRLTSWMPDPDPAQRGDDVVQGGPGGDVIIGGYGADRLRGGRGGEEIHIAKGAGTKAYGGKGRDYLGGYYGLVAVGAVKLFGGSGRDRLNGGERRDLLDGGRGRDFLNGAKGRDRCLRGERLKSCERRR